MGVDLSSPLSQGPGQWGLPEAWGAAPQANGQAAGQGSVTPGAGGGGPEASRISRAERPGEAKAGQGRTDGAKDRGTEGKDGAEGKGGADSVSFSPEARRELERLRKADQEVKAHEAAHLAAAGGLARGGASFSYQKGPDGQQYATAGEVSLDTSAVSGNPSATLAKAQRIRAAALAPASPSPQDRAVAAAASAMAASASAELASQAMGSRGGGEGSRAGRKPEAVGGSLDITA